jgi:hypothetical protein
MRIAIVALLGILAGCSTTQTSMAPSSAAGPAPGPSAGLNRAYNACQAAYERSANPTRTSRAQCLNNAENRFARDFPDPEMLRQQQGLRLALAQRVDSGQITQAAADATYAKEMTRLQAASDRRLAAG